MNYYNEIDPFCCKWLANLMDAGLIPRGKIDQRSIKDVQPNDLDGFTQCHFFAGIAGWPYALQLAGWSADEPVWTGSCPCQPWSEAGNGDGEKDTRHLWPEFRHLIVERKPKCIFGEQVEGAISKGWLDAISADLETEDYAVGACVLGAHSIGATHIRQRLYWVADTTGGRWNATPVENAGKHPKDDGKAGTLATITTRGRFGSSLRSWWQCKPGVEPVVYGLPRRLVECNRAVGNAIVPQVAAEFIKAYMEVLR